MKDLLQMLVVPSGLGTALFVLAILALLAPNLRRLARCEK